MINQNYFLIEILKLMFGCGLLAITTVLINKNKLIALILGVSAIMFFTQITFAH